MSAIVNFSVVVRQQTPRGAALEELQAQFGVSPSTVRRWLVYFQTEFSQSPLGSILRGAISPAYLENPQPLRALESLGFGRKDKEEVLQGWCLLLARSQLEVARSLKFPAESGLAP